MATDFTGYDNVFSPGDFTGDGKADVIARKPADANLYLWTGNGAGGFSAGPTGLGLGSWYPTWFDIIFSPGDFNGDGKADLIARGLGDANLYLFPGNGNGTLTQTNWSVIGVGGWTTSLVDRIFSPGDFNGDGKTDVLARETDGSVYLFPGAGNGTLPQTWSQVTFGGTWAVYDQLFGRGDFDGDGKTDILARDPVSTQLRLFKAMAPVGCRPGQLF